MAVADRSDRDASEPLSDLERRSVAALTEYLYAFDDHGWATEADGLWLVYSEAGQQYRVDVEQGACTCDDAFYRDPDGGCKHIRRVQFLTGEREIPGWVDQRHIDSWLVERLDRLE